MKQSNPTINIQAIKYNKLLYTTSRLSYSCSQLNTGMLLRGTRTSVKKEKKDNEEPITRLPLYYLCLTTVFKKNLAKASCLFYTVNDRYVIMNSECCYYLFKYDLRAVQSDRLNRGF